MIGLKPQSFGIKEVKEVYCCVVLLISKVFITASNILHIINTIFHQFFGMEIFICKLCIITQRNKTSNSITHHDLVIFLAAVINTQKHLRVTAV